MSGRGWGDVGLANARDLGGVSCDDRTVTPSGVFVRAERLDRVTAEGWERLRAYGVASVIDLRRPEERSGRVPPDLACIEVNLDGDEQEFWAPYEQDGRWGTPLYYAAHLAELPHRMRAVLEAIAAAPEGAVLFHCASGWDRTGLVAAVLLKAVGASADGAVRDYLDSFDNAAAMEELHGRPSESEARRRVLARHGHDAESAFRSVYEPLDLEEWKAAARVGAEVWRAIETWRGHVSVPRPAEGADTMAD